MQPGGFGLSTRCVHAGEPETDPQGSPNTPLYPTTTFVFPDTNSLREVVEGRRPGNLYTRFGSNPTLQSTEEKLASLEGAERALLFGSGLAAESAVFLAHGRGGVACIGDVYGGTLELLVQQLPGLGIPTHILLKDDLNQLEAVLKAGASLVFLESPANPTLQVHDIEAICRLAHKHSARVMVDNTFATPVNQQPLALGADFAVHSATKYLGGHSDITAGAVMGSADLLDSVSNWRKSLGQTPAPEIAWLLARSLRTLVVRVNRQNETAATIAGALLHHPRVARVYYPGLESAPDHALAKRQMSGFGGMLTIEVSGDADSASSMVDKLRLFAIAPSLGGVESLVSQPVYTSHFTMPAAERERRGIRGNMVRLSIGLEDCADQLADLEFALDADDAAGARPDK